MLGILTQVATGVVHVISEHVVRLMEPLITSPSSNCAVMEGEMKSTVPVTQDGFGVAAISMPLSNLKINCVYVSVLCECVWVWVSVCTSGYRGRVEVSV